MAFNPKMAAFCFGISEEEATRRFRGGLCVSCGQDASRFSDRVSKQEYAISGLCQGCQDGAFPGEED